jgi:plasmid stabilization system protein ParE
MSVLDIIITKKADKDEIDIYKYISNEFGEVYAKKFRKKLIDLFQILSTQPFIGRPAKNDSSIRVIILSKQNKIIYKITDQSVIIIRLLNTKTNLSQNF